MIYESLYLVFSVSVLITVEKSPLAVLLRPIFLDTSSTKVFIMWKAAGLLAELLTRQVQPIIKPTMVPVKGPTEETIQEPSERVNQLSGGGWGGGTGSSMRPTFVGKGGEQVYVDDGFRHGKGITNGDVLSFKKPGMPCGIHLIKRVKGMAGDTFDTKTMNRYWEVIKV